MKRIRYIVVIALAAASLGIGAAPASACVSDNGPCCEDDAPNVLWRKLFGHDLYQCPG
jgi:hypothetical protein